MFCIFAANTKSIDMTGGKSAVLSALTIALGGKASTTGRGSGLKNFIQTGKTYALEIRD